MKAASRSSKFPSDGFDPRPDNLERALTSINQLADDGAQLLVFGEIFLNGCVAAEFTPDYAVAEDEADPFVAPLVSAAREPNVTS